MWLLWVRKDLGSSTRLNKTFSTYSACLLYCTGLFIFLIPARTRNGRESSHRSFFLTIYQERLFWLITKYSCQLSQVKGCSLNQYLCTYMCICVYIIYITNRLVLSGLKSLSKKQAITGVLLYVFPLRKKKCRNLSKW